MYLRTFTLLLLLFLILTSALIFTACSEDDNSTDPADEFIASEADFDGWQNWTAVGFNKGPADNLGQAHAGNDENATRWIYMKDMGDMPEGGEYPQGTIIVKEVLDADGSQIGLVAMVKRGGDFNSQYGGWEWFAWDGGEMNRGADLMNNACNNCHAAAAVDHVFSDIEGYGASETLFDGYENWPIIAENQGPDEALGPAHAGNDENATRIIRFYSENLKAAANGDYPWGARIIKEVRDGDDNLIALTAMVKQGGDFNPAANGWYWYMWTLDDQGSRTGIAAEGVVSGCNGCHSQAADLDYVFTVNE